MAEFKGNLRGLLHAVFGADGGMVMVIPHTACRAFHSGKCSSTQIGIIRRGGEGAPEPPTHKE